MNGHLPSLTDAGHDAHQIRRGLERAYTDAENAKLRAIKRGWTDIAAAIQEVLTRIIILRETAEETRRANTPERFLQGGAAGASERRDAAAWHQARIAGDQTVDLASNPVDR